MSFKKSLLILLALSTVVFIAACERTITQTIVEQSASQCFECHSDVDTYLISAEAQWANSLHASGFNVNRGSRSSCAGCHASEGFVQRANGEDVTGHDNPTIIHCFTCHAPHSTSDFSLRWSEDVTLMNGESFDLGTGNLCGACHQARRSVDQYVGTPGSTSTVNINSGHWGPHHSTQGDLLLGSNGFEYEGYTYESTGHKIATDNGCVDCHMTGGTSNNVVGGHSFNMRFTRLDVLGEEEVFDNVASCENCHDDVDNYDINGRQTEFDEKLHELEELLEVAGLLDHGHPVEGVTTSVDSAGAVWNWLVVAEDRSRGIHNPKYALGLLQSSIDFLKGDLAPTLPALEE